MDTSCLFCVVHNYERCSISAVARVMDNLKATLERSSGLLFHFQGDFQVCVAVPSVGLLVCSRHNIFIKSGTLNIRLSGTKGCTPLQNV